MIEGTLNQIWFLEANWPLQSNSEITQSHFEDLRKLMFVLKYPACGHYAETWQGNGITTETVLPLGIEALDYDIGDLIIKTSRVVIWTINEPVSKGCWRSISVTGDTYEALSDLSAGANTTSPDSSSNWRKIVDPPALIYTNSSSREWGDGVPDAASFPMPDLHPAAGVWMSNSSDGSSNGWVLRYDKNRYHTFDENSIYKYLNYIDYTVSEGEESVRYRCNTFTKYFFPAQTDSKERNKPWIYQGSLSSDLMDRLYRFKAMPNKKGREKEVITEVDSLGPVLSISGDVSGNPYYIDGGWPPEGGSSPYTNSKYCDSLQAVVETLASNPRLCYPADAEYKSNWEAVHGESWNEALPGCHAYPFVDDECWGCNGSGFELILKKLGTDYYDWYFIPGMSYTPESLTEFMEDYDYMLPLRNSVGLWVRGWKYSMGRPENSFMRPSEMGDPTSTADYVMYNPEPIPGQESMVTLPYCSIFTHEFPERDQFDNIFYESELLNGDTDNYTILATNLSVGDMITFYDSNDETDTDKIVSAWVVAKSVSRAIMSHSIADAKYYIPSEDKYAVCWGRNSYINTRHDPISIEVDPGSTTANPKYDIDYRMLQHAYEVLMECKYIRTPADIEYLPRSGTVTCDLPSSSVTEEMRKSGFGTVFTQLKGDVISNYFNDSDPENWTGDSEGLTGLISGTAYWGFLNNYENNGEPFFEIEESATVTLYKTAIRLTDILEVGDQQDIANRLLKNGKCKAFISYYDIRGSLLDFDFGYNPTFGARHVPLYAGESDYGYNQGIEWQKSATVWGLTRNVVDYYADMPIKYAEISSYLSTDWTILTVPDGGYSQSERYKLSDVGVASDPVNLNYLQTVSGSSVWAASLVDKDIVLELDFDMVPSSVFIDTEGRDRIGAEEPTGSPSADTVAPRPEQTQINRKPKLLWVDNEDETWKAQVNTTVSEGEDIDGGGVYYQVNLNKNTATVSSDWLTDFEIELDSLLELTDEEALGKCYVFNGTPAKLDEFGYEIHESDIVTPVVYWQFNINHSHSIFEGDYVYIPDFELDIGEYGFNSNNIMEVVDAGANTITIACTSQPTSVSSYHIWDVSGYNEAEWNYNYNTAWSVTAQMKDSAGNTNEISESVNVEMPENWPLQTHLDTLGISFEAYIESLED